MKKIPQGKFAAESKALSFPNYPYLLSYTRSLEDKLVVDLQATLQWHKPYIVRDHAQKLPTPCYLPPCPYFCISLSSVLPGSSTIAQLSKRVNTPCRECDKFSSFKKPNI